MGQNTVKYMNGRDWGGQWNFTDRYGSMNQDIVPRLRRLGFSQFCRAVRYLNSEQILRSRMSFIIGGKKFTVKVTEVEEVEQKAFQANIVI
jgi:hypothetical protein